MASKKEGRHIQLWLVKELGERLDALLQYIPYEITISSIGERGFVLALDELERLLKPRTIRQTLDDMGK